MRILENDPPRERSGRSKDAHKRAAILHAARTLFFAHGLDQTAIEDIAAAAGVSKVTVYGHFGDKETLLEAVIRAQASEIEQSLIRPRARGAPLADVLDALGDALLGVMTSPDMEACDRLLSVEAERHPELARRYYEAGPGYVHAQLAAVLAEAIGRGEIAPDDPPRVAEDLIGLWKGMMPVERRFGVRTRFTPAQLTQRVRRGTRLFLRAHALPDGAR